jgi:hypothetical protein
MKIAILEIAPTGHYTYVESIAKIYTAVAGNTADIFTTEKGAKAMQYLENQQISVIKTGSEKADLEHIAGQKYDKIFVVTLEAYAKEPYRILCLFEKIDFGCPLYYVMHNVDFWFKQSITDKFRNIFFNLKNIHDFVYRSKIYFKYVSINSTIIQKVEQSGGAFVTLSETVATELKKYTPSVLVIPFSIFDDSIKDKSQNNTYIRVCLPGYVSAVRRNYEVIIDILNSENGLALKDIIEWDFLGGVSKTEDGEKIITKAKSLIEKGFHINIYDKPSVDLTEFDLNLAKADIVLGNLHLQQGANSSYGKTKESGLIFTMIKAAKPGLMPSEYPFEKTLATSILTFNDYQELPKILIHLRQNGGVLSELKQEALRNSEKYTPLSIFNILEKKSVKNELSKPARRK